MVTTGVDHLVEVETSWKLVDLDVQDAHAQSWRGEGLKQQLQVAMSLKPADH
jgi:hypothetical protein